MSDSPPLPSQRDLLARLTGVWQGHYTFLDREGRRLERFAHRQETRLVGDRWYERIIYRPDSEDAEVLDFRASFDAAGRLTFDDSRFAGQLHPFHGAQPAPARGAISSRHSPSGPRKVARRLSP